MIRKKRGRPVRRRPLSRRKSHAAGLRRVRAPDETRKGAVAKTVTLRKLPETTSHPPALGPPRAKRGAFRLRLVPKVSSKAPQSRPSETPTHPETTTAVQFLRHRARPRALRPTPAPRESNGTAARTSVAGKLPETTSPQAALRRTSDEKHSPGAQLCCTHPVSVPQGGEKSFGTVEPLVREESRGSRMKWRSPAPPHRSSKLSAPFARKTAREAPSTTKGPISATAHVAERSELWKATTELGNQLSDGRKSSVRFGSTTQLEITPRSSTSQKSEGLRRVFIEVCVTTAVAATGVLLMWAMWPYANTVMKYCDSAECKLASEGEPRRRQK
ncbi:hypothetical protein V5799_005649 [Amblyomma americanum]|uniref:Transmembrane protein n=1 Tax=Amblyomma americanum TaxID=6943 RepID=A0AAQ4DYN0_AMBAM